MDVKRDCGTEKRESESKEGREKREKGGRTGYDNDEEDVLCSQVEKKGVDE
jgi:hypothetical protein